MRACACFCHSPAFVGSVSHAVPCCGGINTPRLYSQADVDQLRAEVERLRDELTGALATVKHLTAAMSWVSGHDRQGLDHLDEAQALAAQLAEVRRLCDEHSEFARLDRDDPEECAAFLAVAVVDVLAVLDSPALADAAVTE
jgi:hypothetical protein